MVQVQLRDYVLRHLLQVPNMPLAKVPDTFDSVDQYKEWFRPFLFHETIASLCKSPVLVQVYQNEENMYYKPEEVQVKPFDVFVWSKQGFPTSMNDTFTVYIVKKCHQEDDQAEIVFFECDCHSTTGYIHTTDGPLVLFYLGNIGSSVRVEQAINNSENTHFLFKYMRALPSKRTGWFHSEKSITMDLMATLNQYI